MGDSTLATNTISTVLQWMSKHVVEIIVLLSVFLEISKIKINPISGLIKFIFRPIRKELELMRKEFKEEMTNMENRLSEQIESIKSDQDKEKQAIDELIYSNEMSEISRIRWEIIEFANSINNGQLHVRDEYRHIKDEYKKYEHLIEKYDLENGIVTEEMLKINKHYEDNKETSMVYF